jgi:CHASE2 domain-containing sensor protein
MKLRPAIANSSSIFLLTIISFILTFLVSMLSQTSLFRFIFPETIALENFDYTDYVFQLRKSDKHSQDIVIVNIGNLKRRQIAEQVRILSKYQPKVIAINAFFDCIGRRRDTVNCPQLTDWEGNLALSDAIRAAGNVVLVNRPLAKQVDGPIDSLRKSDDIFTDYALAQGHSHLGNNNDAYQKTYRSFTPQLFTKNETFRSFAVEIAFAYDSISTSKFLSRKKTFEFINYTGDIFDLNGENSDARFYSLDTNDIFEETFTPESIKNKIVMLGFLGEFLGDRAVEDKLYTPLNDGGFNGEMPDMFGTVVQANVVQMIIDENWIDSMSEIGEYIFAFVVTFLHITVLLYTLNKWPAWFDAVAIALIPLQLLMYAYLRIYAFYYYAYKIELIVTLGCLTIASIVVSIFNAHVTNLFSKLLTRKAPVTDVESELFSNHD